METVLGIMVVGLTLALAAALLVIRRRSDEIDALLGEASAARSAHAATAARAAEPATATIAPVAANPTPTPAALEPVSVDELLPVGLVHLDASRRVDRANTRAHELLDVAAPRLLGRTVMETFLDAHVDTLVSEVPVDGSASHEVLAGDAQRRTVILRIHRRAEDGTWIVIEDVSELRRLQQIRAEFIDNLSHELRTPLTTVSLLAETLARDADSADVPQRMRERIAKVEIETGHLVQMVSELLDLARIEGGTHLRMLDDVDLGRLAVASTERLRLFAERQGVVLSAVPEPGLPPVRGDEDRLGQVFVNLVHNAVKFSPNGGDVVVAVRHENDRIVSSVADHGVGIARADRDRIFERFYKADRARVRGGGTGLGLAIARHIVEGHGGRIWVDSIEGRGSTFTFAIPVTPGP